MYSCVAYEFAAKSVAQVGKKLRINGENIVSLEFDRDSGTVAAFIDEHVELLNITYDVAGRPFKWGPRYVQCIQIFYSFVL